MNSIEHPRSAGSKRWLAIAASISILLIITVLMASDRQRRSRNECINNLRQIHGAKECWALEVKRTIGSTLDAQDISHINLYIKNGQPNCPRHGAYSYNPIGSPPTCSIRGHTL